MIKSLEAKAGAGWSQTLCAAPACAFCHEFCRNEAAGTAAMPPRQSRGQSSSDELSPADAEDSDDDPAMQEAIGPDGDGQQQEAESMDEEDEDDDDEEEDEEEEDHRTTPMNRRGLDPRVRNTLDPSGTGAPGESHAAGGMAMALGGAVPWESPSAEQVKLMVQHLSPRSRDDEETAEIRVGSAYQCPIPPVKPMSATEPVDETRLGTLVYDPNSMPADGVAKYLERSAEVRHPTDFPCDAALVHLHACGYDADAAVNDLPELSAASLPDVKQLDDWTPEDIAKFEEGMTRFGKDFRKIHKLMDGKYPVAMVILFYFARWKKLPNFRVWQARWKDYNRDECKNCRKGGELLCCDGCPAAYHAVCCHPPYVTMGGVPDDEWFCMACVQRRTWLKRCRVTDPKDTVMTAPARYSHTPTGGMNIGAPFSPAARFLPPAPTPDQLEMNDADADTDEGPLSISDGPPSIDSGSGDAPSRPVAVRKRVEVSSSNAGHAAAVGSSAASAAEAGVSPDLPSSGSAAASAGDNKRRRGGDGGGKSDASAGGDDDEEAEKKRSKKGKSRGPGTPTVDEDEQTAALEADAAAAKPAPSAAAASTAESTSPKSLGKFLRGEVVAVRGDPAEDSVAPFWICAVHGQKKGDLDATWFESAANKPMGVGVRMRQLNWRDKVSIDTVLCRLRFGGGRGDTKLGERKPCDPPMTVSLTQQEWDTAILAKKESEVADELAAAKAAEAAGGGGGGGGGGAGGGGVKKKKAKPRKR